MKYFSRLDGYRVAGYLNLMNALLKFMSAIVEFMHGMATMWIVLLFAARNPDETHDEQGPQNQGS